MGLALLLATAACQTPPPAPIETEPPPAASPVDMSATPEGFVKMTVWDVAATGQGFAVLLIDEARQRALPIFIGPSQAQSILLRVERRRFERPLTHDLMDDVVEKLGGKVEKVHVDGLRTGVFVGTIFVSADGTVHEFDARPSDAIALAEGNRVPIFVATEVLDQAGLDPEQAKALKIDLDELRPLPDEGLPSKTPL